MFVELPLPRPDAEERTERHLAMAAKLADLAMQLAQAAAARALRRAAADEEADAAALPPKPSRRAGPDPAREFAMLSREVGRLVILEANVAAGWPRSRPGPARDRARSPAPDRGKARVRKIMQDAIRANPNGPGREVMLQRIDAALEDPEVEKLIADAAPLGDVVRAIWLGFDVPVDGRRLPRLWDGAGYRPPVFRPMSRPPPEKPATGPDPPD